MKNIDDISEKVEKRKTQLQPLFTKDKENYDLWIGAEQIFDKHPMFFNITGTEMSALPRRIQASLMRQALDIHVLPPNPQPSNKTVCSANDEERMYYYGLNEADERLTARGEAPILASASWQITNLGRTTFRVLVYADKDGKVIWDIMPMVPSLVTFEFDEKGLAWYRYETFRSSAAIKSEYGEDITEETQGKGISVSDYWDREHNVRYLTKEKKTLSFEVGGEKVTAWEHELEEVPALIIPVTLGPKVVTPEGIDVTAWGQSIYDHVKTPFRNLNKLRSIVATQAHLNAQAPLVAKDKDGSGHRVEEQELSRYPGAVINVPESVDLDVLDTKDVPPSILTMMGDISTGIQRATYTELSPDAPGHSGAALKILRQDMQDVVSPRGDSLNKLHTGICRMAKRQIIKKGLTIPVRTVVDKEYAIYDMKPKLLDNDFYVSAEFIRKDVYDEVEVLQEAQIYQDNRWMSRESIMEKMLKMQDVPAEIEEMDMDEVEAEIPEMKLRRIAKRLVDRYDSLMEQGIEDKDLAEKIKQMKGQLAMLEIQKQQALMGAMGQGGMGQPTGQTGGAPTRPVVPGVPT